MMKNKTLGVLALIMIVNALGFGMIIPILYPFAKQYGINPQGIGLLIASFSIAQFVATPVLGALSDKYGRKPILVISLLGTAVSFVLFAEAPNIFILFTARILDGLTGGNISVAQAVISDITKPEERTKAFGILGATFGFGFLVGPALGGSLSAISMAFPFYFAAALAVIGAGLSTFVLRETRVKNAAHINQSIFFNIKVPFASLRRPVIGKIIGITLLLAIAQFCMIVGFQTFNVDILKLTPSQIGWFFAGFASVSILMQMAGIRIIFRFMKSRPAVLVATTFLSAVTMFAASQATTFFAFAAAIIFSGLTGAFRDPILNGLLTEHSEKHEQGKILGINQSYVSIGQIIGPVTAGFISRISVPYIFIASSVFIIFGMLMSWSLLRVERGGSSR